MLSSSESASRGYFGASHDRLSTITRFAESYSAPRKTCLLRLLEQGAGSRLFAFQLRFSVDPFGKQELLEKTL
jgi:hypothetical protein